MVGLNPLTQRITRCASVSSTIYFFLFRSLREVVLFFLRTVVACITHGMESREEVVCVCYMMFMYNVYYFCFYMSVQDRGLNGSGMFLNGDKTKQTATCRKGTRMKEACVCGEINKDEEERFGVTSKTKCTVRLCIHVSMSVLRYLYISLGIGCPLSVSFVALLAPPSNRSCAVCCCVCLIIGPMKNTICKECCCVCI